MPPAAGMLSLSVFLFDICPFSFPLWCNLLLSSLRQWRLIELKNLAAIERKGMPLIFSLRSKRDRLSGGKGKGFLG